MMRWGTVVTTALVILSLVLLRRGEGLADTTSYTTSTVYTAALHDKKVGLEVFRKHFFSTSTAQQSKPFNSAGYLENLAKRYQIFLTSLREIVAVNERRLGYTVDLNFMAFLSEEERGLYHGLNLTLTEETQHLTQHVQAVRTGGAPEAVDWLASGHVTYVQNQGMCKSCWTFAGVGPLETRYALATGTLKKFSEQESLECVYDKEEHDGCRQGGQFFLQWEWIIKNQHQASDKDYPYKGRIYSCRKSWFKNTLTHAKVSHQVRVGNTYEDMISALVSGPVAVGIKVSKELNLYKEGIFVKEDCGTPANHAVVVVGYNSRSFRIKNSWGVRWGESGFVSFSRRVPNMCDISLWVGYPALEQTQPTPDISGSGCTDKRSDCESKVAACGNGTDWKLMATGCAKTCGVCGCRDAMAGCNEWAGAGYCSKPNYTQYMKWYCPLSCRACHIHPQLKEKSECVDRDEKCGHYDKRGYCTRHPNFMSNKCDKTCHFCEDKGECPNGLIMCNGECQHVHMC